MEREKPLPWTAFIGCALTMLSLVIALVLNVTVLGQSIGTNMSQPLASLLALILLILGIVLMYEGLRKID